MINYCPSTEQVADIFTKCLASNKFKYFREKIMCKLD